MSPLQRHVMLIIFRRMIAVYCENDLKHTNTACGQCSVIMFSEWYVYLPLYYRRLDHVARFLTQYTIINRPSGAAYSKTKQ